MAEKKSEKELYWQDVLDRQAGSGLSVRQFCAKERVSEPSFYAWRRKLGGPKNGRGRRGTTSRRVSVSGNGKEFIPLKLVDGSSKLEVIHPRGYRVQVTGEVNAVDLQRVLDVLDARSDG